MKYYKLKMYNPKGRLFFEGTYPIKNKYGVLRDIRAWPTAKVVLKVVRSENHENYSLFY